MTELELQDALAGIRRSGAETNGLIDEGRAKSAEFFDEALKRRAEARKYERESTALAMAAGAALLGVGAVIGGLVVRLFTGH
jgi:cyclopropane fatty-acyl-phospholipid synthase-like methyltransferase